MATDLSWLPPLIGTTIGGAFALGGGYLQAWRTAKTARDQIAHDDQRDEKLATDARSAEERANSGEVANLALGVLQVMEKAFRGSTVTPDDVFATWAKHVWAGKRLGMLEVIGALHNDTLREQLNVCLDAATYCDDLSLIYGPTGVATRWQFTKAVQTAFELASAGKRGQEPDEAVLKTLNGLREDVELLIDHWEDQNNRV